MNIKKYFKLEFNGTDIPIFIQSVGFLIWTIIFKEIGIIMLISVIIRLLVDILF